MVDFPGQPIANNCLQINADDVLTITPGVKSTAIRSSAIVLCPAACGNNRVLADAVLSGPTGDIDSVASTRCLPLIYINLLLL
jgi:hypothetical protein